MLSKQMNERITQTGPGTPLGEAFRRYWMPALLSEEIPTPDCPPVRIGLLGEKLVAFRDTTVRSALVAENCPHRGASLFFGRNEEAGLRCVYHGWKFDASGACVDMPNEPPESNFKHKVKVAAYPCVERGGVIWAYMGPAEKRPPDRIMSGLDSQRVAPSARRHTRSATTFSRWKAVSTPHTRRSCTGCSRRKSANSAATLDRAAIGLVRQRRRLVVLKTDFGFTYASIRNVNG